jgi:hypothetical protein
MSNKINSIIEKVQKLISLSKSSNINEAAAAAAAANKLIDQYRLSEADLNSETELDDPLIEDSGFVYETKKIIGWKSNLAINLASHYGCAIMNSTFYPSGRKVSRYKLFGKKSDIEITRYMFSWLTNECIRLCQKEAHGRGKIFAQSYCQGFVAGIKSQLETSRNAVKKEATSSAIIKIDSREKESLNFRNKLYSLKAGKYQSASKIDPAAFSAGLNKGKSLHLGQGISQNYNSKMLELSK